MSSAGTELRLEITEVLSIPYGKRHSVETVRENAYYSAAARMALASLWDVSEDIISPERDIRAYDDIQSKDKSMQRFNTDIRRVLLAYHEADCWPDTGKAGKSKYIDAVVSDIDDNLQATGHILHSAYRVAPALHRSAPLCGIRCVRGISAGAKVRMSGAGPYVLTQDADDLADFQDMFNLSCTDLSGYLDQLISHVSWNSAGQSQIRREYLDTERRSYGAYWTTKKPSNEGLYLSRADDYSVYWLERIDRGKHWETLLADWRCEKGGYRLIANAILMKHGTLPPIEYSLDQHIVDVYLGYLLPSAESALFRLYSWPSLDDFRVRGEFSDFHRVMHADVFAVFKKALQSTGFVFKERRM